MNYIEAGKIITTHGLKGELKIRSNFSKKYLIFQPGKNLYLGETKEKLTISSYRVHQNYDLLIFEEYSDISEVIALKNKIIYFNRHELDLNSEEYLLEDLINFQIIEEKEKLGIIKNIMYNKNNILLFIEAEKNFYIPYNDYFILKVDLNNKKIITQHAKELIL